MSKSHSSPEDSRGDWEIPEEADWQDGDLCRADLKAYLDGELPTWRRWQVRWHLAHCPACREEVTWLARLGNRIHDLDKAVPRPELRARILANLPDVPPGRLAGNEGPLNLLPRPAPRRVPRLALGGALAAFAAVGAFALARTGLPFFHSAAAPTEAPRLTALPPPDRSVASRNGGAQAEASQAETRRALPLYAGQGGTSRPAQTANRSNFTSPSRSSFFPADPSQLEAQRLASNTPSEPSDGTYRAAELLTRQRLAALQTEAQRQRALLAHIRPPQSAPQKPTPRKLDEPIRLALAVPDVSGAKARLQTLIQSVGGDLTVRPSQTLPLVAPHAPLESNAPSPANPAGSNSGPAKAAPPAARLAEAPILTLRVPADHAYKLLSSLQQMGVLSQLPPAQDKAQGPSRADRVFIRQAEDEAPGSTGKIVSRAKVDIAALVQSYEISLRKRGGEPPEMAQSPTAAKPFITILLRLEPQKAAVQKG